MSRTFAVMAGLIIVVSGLCLHAASSETIGKPTWRVGDSWKVTMPVLAQRQGHKPVKAGEATTFVRVREQAKVRGVDCYVLQVDAGGESPGPAQNSDRGAVSSAWAYYTVSDLKLVRIEHRSADKEARLLDRRNARRGEQIPAITRQGTPIPLLLPAFPLVAGRSAVLSRAELKDYDTVTRERKGENVITSSSTEADIEAASAAERARAGPGAVKVRFREVVTYSRSGKSESVEMEQVWTPGRPWWSSLRLYLGPDDREGTELMTAW